MVPFGCMITTEYRLLVAKSATSNSEQSVQFVLLSHAAKAQHDGISSPQIPRDNHDQDRVRLYKAMQAVIHFGATKSD
jgi:hypothetical protein